MVQSWQNDSLTYLVKTRSYTATTTSAGIVQFTALTPGNSAPIIAYDTAGNFYFIRRGSAGWIAKVTDNGFDVIANTSVTFFVKYLEYTES